MLPEFSFPTVAYGIEILLRAFVSVDVCARQRPSQWKSPTGRGLVHDLQLTRAGYENPGRSACAPARLGLHDCPSRPGRCARDHPPRRCRRRAQLEDGPELCVPATGGTPASGRSGKGEGHPRCRPTTSRCRTARPTGNWSRKTTARCPPPKRRGSRRASPRASPSDGKRPRRSEPSASPHTRGARIGGVRPGTNCRKLSSSGWSEKGRRMAAASS